MPTLVKPGPKKCGKTKKPDHVDPCGLLDSVGLLHSSSFIVLHFSTFLLENVLPKNLIPSFLEGIIIARTFLGNTGVPFWVPRVPSDI